MRREIHILGGKAVSALNKAKASERLQNYLRNPKICPACNKPIIPRNGQGLYFVLRQKYCSKSCAAAINNHTSPKRRPQNRFCKDCGNVIDQSAGYVDRSICDPCWEIRKQMLSSRMKKDSSHNEIRNHARQMMNGHVQVCAHCGWDHVVETCHIKPVANFPPTALLREINDLNNLIYLCPNCHWDLDHGLLTLHQ